MLKSKGCTYPSEFKEKSSDMEMVERRERQCSPVPRPTPWLVFPHGKGHRNQAFCSVSEPKQTFLKSIPELRRKLFQASFHGWLLLYEENEDESCSLFNPVSLETIHLPPLKSFKITQIDICTLSSPPNDPNCTLFLFDKDIPRIIFCRLGDQQWIEQEYGKVLRHILGHEYRNDPFGEAVSFDGKLYAQTTNGVPKMVVIEVDGANHLNMTPLGIDLLCRIENTLRLDTYLVESFGELFLVFKAFRGLTVKEVKTIKVFRVDFSQMVCVEVKSLKDRALFLGNQCSTSCYTTESGIEGNSIYFTMEEDKNLYSFNLEEGSVSVSTPCPNLPTPWYSPIWVMPDLRVIDVGEGKNRIYVEECEGNDDKEVKEYDYNVKDLEEKREEEESHWANLLPDILALVADRLTLFDYMHFRAICREFRSVAPPKNWRTTCLGSKTQTLSPWFMFLKNDAAICNFINSMDSDAYLMNIPELLVGTSICCSKDGWLLMSRELDSIFFFNPFTREMGQYPLLSGLYYIILEISFSTLPTSSDCIVVAISKSLRNEIIISYIWSGEREWNIILLDDKTDFIPNNSAVFYDGAFYYLGLHGNLGVLDIKEDGDGWKVLDKPERPCNSFHNSFLAEWDGELLSVFMGHLGKWVRVFKLDRSAMVWVEVKSLGNHMLFVSNSSSFSAVASTPGMENKIYFPRFHGKCGIVFYSLETRSYHCIGREDSMKQDFCDTREQKDCCWIEPRWF